MHQLASTHASGLRCLWARGATLRHVHVSPERTQLWMSCTTTGLCEPSSHGPDPRPSVPSSQGMGCLAYPWHTAHSQAASGLHFLLNSATVLWGLPASRFSPLHPPGLSSSNKYITSHKAFPHPVGSALTSATAGHITACHLLPSVHLALQPSPTLPKSPAMLWILLLCSCQNPLMQFPTPASLQFHWERIQKSPPHFFFTFTSSKLFQFFESQETI